MLGLKNHFDISGCIEIREVDIAGVAYMLDMAVGCNFVTTTPIGTSHNMNVIRLSFLCSSISLEF